MTRSHTLRTSSESSQPLRSAKRVDNCELARLLKLIRAGKFEQLRKERNQRRNHHG